MTKKRTLHIREIPQATYLIRFIHNVRVCDKTGCWNWVAARNRDGYGNFCYHSTQVSSHIFIMKFTGRYEEGLLVDHVCRNRACCNPDHLRMVTARTNVVENNSSPAYLNANKTFCNYGHPFNGENTGWSTSISGNPRRVCLACKRERRKLKGISP